MASAKQAQANRLNGALSHGPLTVEGRRIAAANATRHGLCASGEMLIPGEDLEEFAAFAARMRDDIAPSGEVEEVLTGRLVSLAWRLRRVPRVEAELLRWHHLEERLERARAEAESYITVDEDALDEDEQIVTRPRLYIRALKAVEEGAQAQNEATSLGRAFQRCSGATDALGLVGRYERGLERSFLQCLHELQRLQAARSGREVRLPVAVDVHLDSVGENGFVR